MSLVQGLPFHVTVSIGISLKRYLTSRITKIEATMVVRQQPMISMVWKVPLVILDLLFEIE